MAVPVDTSFCGDIWILLAECERDSRTICLYILEVDSNVTVIHFLLSVLDPNEWTWTLIGQMEPADFSTSYKAHPLALCPWVCVDKDTEP